MTRTVTLKEIDEINVMLDEAAAIIDVAAGYVEGLGNTGTALPSALAGGSHLIKMAKERLYKI